MDIVYEYRLFSINGLRYPQAVSVVIISYDLYTIGILYEAIVIIICIFYSLCGRDSFL